MKGYYFETTLEFISVVCKYSVEQLFNKFWENLKKEKKTANGFATKFLEKLFPKTPPHVSF